MKIIFNSSLYERNNEKEFYNIKDETYHSEEILKAKKYILEGFSVPEKELEYILVNFFTRMKSDKALIIDELDFCSYAMIIQKRIYNYFLNYCFEKDYDLAICSKHNMVLECIRSFKINHKDIFKKEDIILDIFGEKFYLSENGFFIVAEDESKKEILESFLFTN